MSAVVVLLILAGLGCLGLAAFSVGVGRFVFGWAGLFLVVLAVYGIPALAALH